MNYPVLFQFSVGYKHSLQPLKKLFVVLKTDYLGFEQHLNKLVQEVTKRHKQTIQEHECLIMGAREMTKKVDAEKDAVIIKLHEKYDAEVGYSDRQF